MTQGTLDFVPPAHACDLHILAESVSPEPQNPARMLVAKLIELGAASGPVEEGKVTAQVHDRMVEQNIRLRVVYTLSRFLSDMNGEYCPKCSVPNLVKVHGWILVSFGSHGENRDICGKGMLRLMTINDYNNRCGQRII